MISFLLQHKRISSARGYIYNSHICILYAPYPIFPNCIKANIPVQNCHTNKRLEAAIVNNSLQGRAKDSVWDERGYAPPPGKIFSLSDATKLAVQLRKTVLYIYEYDTLDTLSTEQYT